MMRLHGSLGTVALVLLISGCAGLTEGGDAPQVADIVCEDGTQVLTATVRAQADGVHLRVDNKTGAERFIYKQEGPDSALNQHVAPPGVSEAVSVEAPGSWRVICSAPALYPQEVSPWAELEVADPEGLWLPDRPACDHIEGTHPDYFEDRPRGHTGDILEAARREIPGELPDHRPGDEVEPAGYPESDPRFRVVRGGQVVAVAHYIDDGHGGWLFGGIEYCVDDDDGGEPEPTY